MNSYSNTPTPAFHQPNFESAFNNQSQVVFSQQYIKDATSEDLSVLHLLNKHSAPQKEQQNHQLHDITFSRSAFESRYNPQKNQIVLSRNKYSSSLNQARYQSSPLQPIDQQPQNQTTPNADTSLNVILSSVLAVSVLQNQSNLQKKQVQAIKTQFNLMKTQIGKSIRNWRQKFNQQKRQIIAFAKNMDTSYKNQRKMMQTQINNLKKQLFIVTDQNKFNQNRYLSEVQHWQQQLENLTQQLIVLKDQLSQLNTQNQQLHLANKNLINSQLNLQSNQSELQRIIQIKNQQDQYIINLKERIQQLEGQLGRQRRQAKINNMEGLENALEKFYQWKFRQSVEEMENRKRRDLEEELEVEKLYYCRLDRQRKQQIQQLNQQIQALIQQNKQIRQTKNTLSIKLKQCMDQIKGYQSKILIQTPQSTQMGLSDDKTQGQTQNVAVKQINFKVCQSKYFRQGSTSPQRSNRMMENKDNIANNFGNRAYLSNANNKIHQIPFRRQRHLSIVDRLDSPNKLTQSQPIFTSRQKRVQQILNQIQKKKQTNSPLKYQSKVVNGSRR